ncbi:hypothetical protein F2P81_017548 [Scophthalmus maximus]|uniref:Uncharacterized protein n=1 Tax=Scophthalmus maximus TaxID=52904 RepID=A0A6A4SC87_SCOMX|nr:hypothetical protein F2P81_017548 [Scophthalmus maximus]
MQSGPVIVHPLRCLYRDVFQYFTSQRCGYRTLMSCLCYDQSAHDGILVTFEFDIEAVKPTILDIYLHVLFFYFGGFSLKGKHVRNKQKVGPAAADERQALNQMTPLTPTPHPTTLQKKIKSGYDLRSIGGEKKRDGGWDSGALFFFFFFFIIIMLLPSSYWSKFIHVYRLVDMFQTVPDTSSYVKISYEYIVDETFHCGIEL